MSANLQTHATDSNPDVVKSGRKVEWTCPLDEAAVKK